MMKVLIGWTVAFSLLANGAEAAMDRWVSEILQDPFAGAGSVNVWYESQKFGVAITCGIKKRGLDLFVIHEELRLEPAYNVYGVVEVAVDGVRIVGENGTFSMSRNNVATVVVKLPPFASEWLAEELVGARKQIAINDGVSARLYHFNVVGTTAAGKAILSCLKQQKS